MFRSAVMALTGMLALPALAGTVVLPALAGAVALPALAGTLDELLGRGQAHLPPVTVSGWIERGGRHPVAVVSLVPEDEVSLVADPGVTVTAEGDWLVAMPHEEVEPGRAYFEPPLRIRLPFAAEDGLPLRLRVDYAYCYTDLICLFGEAEVTLATRAP
jgi:hypothetical protein